MNVQGFETELWNNFKATYAGSRMEMLKSGQLTLNGKTMKFIYKTKGNRPPNGYTLVIGLHGGGGCPAEVNNQQYNNHKGLYDKQLPDGTIWLAPRSCEDVWDMWFQDYMQDFILQFIRAFALNDLIDLNKVFLTGYSAGGDGVYQLSPRIADHLAGAAMMAGHPNGVNFMNIRNIGFSIQVGENDNDYNRKNEGVKYIRMISQLGQNYGGFKHQSKIHPGKPHWMGKQDAKMFPWLLDFVRNPYPDVILFKQCPRRKQTSFYYLKLGESKNGKNDEQTVVLREGNTFKIFSNRRITVRVNRKFINPAENIRIIHNNVKTIQRPFQARREVAEKTLLEKIDPYYIFEDQFQSDPPSVIDIKSTICSLFSISEKEKQAEYEQSLPVKFDKTPSNFSKSLEPLVPRTKPLCLVNQQVQQTQVQYGQNGGGGFANINPQGNQQNKNQIGFSQNSNEWGSWGNNYSQGNPYSIQNNPNQWQAQQSWQNQGRWGSQPENQWQNSNQTQQSQWQNSNQNQWQNPNQNQQFQWQNQGPGQNINWQNQQYSNQQGETQFNLPQNQQNDCKIF